MTDPLFLIDIDHEDTPINSGGLHSGWNLTLPESVKRHAIVSMRMGPGQGMQLSDGHGLRIQAVLTDSDRAQAQVVTFGTEPRPMIRLALIQALAKTGHDLEAIDAATEIGVDTVIPWQADRSIAKWKAGKSEKRWSQTLRAASEQSRRSWVPELETCVSSDGVLAICRRACVHGDMVIVLHQDGTSDWQQVEQSVRSLSDRCLLDGHPHVINVVVGPEGGIGEQEIDRFLSAGACSCRLGGNILRTSLAGPVALTLLSHSLGRFDHS